VLSRTGQGFAFPDKFANAFLPNRREDQRMRMEKKADADIRFMGKSS